jgi:hypothetical protein
MEIVHIIVFLILIILINMMLKNTNFYKNKFIDTYKFKNIPKNLEIINLGSNQPKFAFDYSNSNVLGMNWAVGPQSFEYDFRLLKNYHNYLKVNGKVLITICPFGFFFLDDKNKIAHHKYYNFLDPSLIDNYSIKTKRLYIDFPILTAKKQILRIIKDVKSDHRLELKLNPMSSDEIEKDAKYWLNAWIKQFGLKDLNYVELSDENKSSIDKNIRTLKEMISFCKENNFEPVLLVLPVTKELSRIFPDEFMQKYIINYINEANEQDVKFLNYWKDGRFENQEFYINSFFMNKIGRSKFTKQVLEDLEK